ncbi:MAG: ATP-binding protein [Oscillospiraceae bacterium]|nr:ATP-binding protein [Oscillospiraceae bacterium]
MGKVILICGMIGSGKTTYANRLAKQLNAVMITQDELMYGLFGTQLYHNDREQYYKYATWVEDYVKQKSGEAAKAGALVICDNGFWPLWQRNEWREFYASMGVTCELHYIDTPQAQRLKNIQKRNEAILREECNESFMNEEDIHHDFDVPSDDEITVTVAFDDAR